ncbi:TPA: DUF723 domain-containing protein [Escherichia coli]
MPKKLTTEEFIAKARAIHGDKYDYSKVVYKNYSSPVTIICPVHGEFPQRPDNHLMGKGCRECGGNAPLNTETFIAKAKAVHGDKYDYSKVVYKGATDKVIIVCPVHGEFEQIASNHLAGSGCDKCGKLARAAKRNKGAQFVERAKAIHGDKYDYSLVEYKSARSPVTIICPVHGEFTQTPDRHLAGRGCRECGGNAPLDTETFLNRVREKYGDDLYDYSLVDYKGNDKKVKIICKRCGTHFEKTPRNHYIGGQGCPQCSERAQSNHIYLLVDSEYKPTRMKIGITNNPKLRLWQLRSGNKHKKLQPTPFKIFKRACYKVGPGKAYEIEQMFHRYYASRNLGYTGFDGATEWFEYDPQAEKLLAEIAANMKATA